MEIFLDEIKRKPFDEVKTLFKYIENISSGSFGTVVRALQIKTGKEIAMKIINKSSKKIDTSKIKEEVNILKELNHPNILKYYDYIETNTKLYIIMEDLKGGTLRKWLKENIKNNIKEEKISVIIKNILSAVSYLHSKNICHRDLKLENIMFKDLSDLNTIKLIDFGLSVKNFDNFGEKDYCGTYIYMAPEQLENKIYSKIIDEWSIGIILFELLNKGNHPFYINGKNKKEYLKRIKKCEIKYYNKISKMAENLIKKMLEPDPLIRISSKVALTHPWITRKILDPIPLNLYQKITLRNINQKINQLMIIMIFLNYYNKNHQFNNNNDCHVFYVDDFYIQKLQKIDSIKKENFRIERLKSFNVENDNFKIESTRNFQKNNNLKKFIEFNSKSTINHFNSNREQLLPSLTKKTFYKKIKLNNKLNDIKSISSRKTDISKEDSSRKKDISKDIFDSDNNSIYKNQNIFIKRLKLLPKTNLLNEAPSLPLINPKNYNLNNSESLTNNNSICNNNKEKNNNSISPYKGIMKKKSYKQYNSYKKKGSSSMENIHLYINNPVKLFDSEKKEKDFSLNISKFIGNFKNNINLFPIKFQNILRKQKNKENPKLYFIKKENIKIDKNYILHNYEIK